MQFGLRPQRGAIDAVFILRRMQEEYHARGKKLYMCSMDLEKAFDIVPRNVLEWGMRKKAMPEVLCRSVISLYEGAKTEPEWIMNCQRSLSLEWGCTKNLNV